MNNARGRTTCRHQQLGCGSGCCEAQQGLGQAGELRLLHVCRTAAGKHHHSALKDRVDLADVGRLEVLRGGAADAEVFLPRELSRDCERTRVEHTLQRKNGLGYELSLCLSRACLGKLIVFTFKGGRERPFAYRDDREIPAADERNEGAGEHALHCEGHCEAVHEHLVGQRVEERSDCSDLLPLAGEVAVEEVCDGRGEEAAEDEIVAPDVDPVDEDRGGQDTRQRQRVRDVDRAHDVLRGCGSWRRLLLG